MANLINAQLSQEDQQAILAALDSIKEKLPFMVSLSPRQRQTLPKMDDARRPFVEKALEYGEKEPNIVPPYLDLDGMKNDLEIFRQLQTIARDCNRLSEMISDTLVAASSDAYSAALTMYNSSKMAAANSVPGMDTVVADLKKLFENKSSSES